MKMALRQSRTLPKRKSNTRQVDPRRYDTKYLGTEEQALADFAKCQAITYNWYSHFHTTDDAVEYLRTYLRAEHGSARITNIPKHYLHTLGWKARILTKGFGTPELKQSLETRLDELRTKYGATRKPKAAVKTKEETTPRADHSGELIGKLEEVLDRHYTDSLEKDFSVYEFLQSEQAKPLHVGRAIAYYKPLVEEYDAMAKGELELPVDITKRSAKRELAFLTGFLEELGQYVGNTKKSRKRRSKRAPTVNVNKVSYQKSDTTLRLESINPADILGALMLVVYNTKYRTLGIFHAKEGGLSIKGTTLQNFDEAKSTSKKIRKPNEQLANIVKAKVSTVTAFKAIRAKESALTGRLNNNTILMKVFK